jgi:hypothetical protein
LRRAVAFIPVWLIATVLSHFLKLTRLAFLGFHSAQVEGITFVSPRFQSIFSSFSGII